MKRNADAHKAVAEVIAQLKEKDPFDQIRVEFEALRVQLHESENASDTIRTVGEWIEYGRINYADGYTKDAMLMTWSAGLRLLALLNKSDYPRLIDPDAARSVARMATELAERHINAGSKLREHRRRERTGEKDKVEAAYNRAFNSVEGFRNWTVRNRTEYLWENHRAQFPNIKRESVAKYVREHAEDLKKRASSR